MNMKAKMPCILALALLENQAAMAAGTFNSSLAPFSLVLNADAEFSCARPELPSGAARKFLC